MSMRHIADWHRRGRSGGVAQVSKPVRPAAILAAVSEVAGRTAKIAISRTALESGATPLAARSASVGNRDALISIFLPSNAVGQSTRLAPEASNNAVWSSSKMLLEILLVVALIAVLVLAGLTLRRQRDMITALLREKVKIQTEERRVFDFLHGIGEALKDDQHVADLHGLIVEGALRILEAQGGVLYRVNKAGTILDPVYVSKGCPPFVDLPKLPPAAATSIQNQIRLHAVAADAGLIGGVLAQDAPLSMERADVRLAPAAAHGANSAFLAPLAYAGDKMGVLVVARVGTGEPFNAGHFSTFKALAEQSAFSLFDAFLHHEAIEKRQLEKELQIATEVQRVLLPTVPPAVEGYEIAGTNLPARYVSGDYFDYIPLDEDRCGIVIADVSGKGISAALLMAMVRSALRILATENISPADVIRRLNAQMYPDIKEDMFISLAYAVIDQRKPEIQLVRAGHDAPLVYRARDRSVEKVNPPGMAVGIDSGGAFNRVTANFCLILEPGDCLVFYTDGVTEAMNQTGDEFGLEAMIRAVQASAPDGAAGVIQRVTSDVKAFIGNQPPHDDITLISILKK